MEKVKSLIVSLCLAVSSTLALAQQVNELGPNTEYNFADSDAFRSQQARQVETDTAVRFPAGEAPLYSALSSYILLLYPLYLQGRTTELQREADALGLPLEQYQEVLATLQLYRARAQNEWSERQLELCRPVLLTGDISNEEAIQALVELDNNTDQRNAIAYSVLEEVGEKFGNEVESAVQNHLESYRAAMTFSRTDMVKFVEVKTNMDHRTFFINQCLAR